jgi:pimeloyl-ACP methyl ester carboxylesterase
VREAQRVRFPVTVVRGEHDAVAPKPWAAEVARLARGRLRMIPRRGHAVVWSASGGAAEAALALLGESA